MPWRSPQRDIVARTPYRPPVAEATRMGGRRVAWRLASAGVLVGMTIVAGVALSGAWSSQPVEVRYRAPAAPAAASQARLVVETGHGRMKLMRGDAVAWRGDGPVDCVTGRAWREAADGAALVARACVRLADGAIVSLAGRVPAGAVVDVR